MVLRQCLPASRDAAEKPHAIRIPRTLSVTIAFSPWPLEIPYASSPETGAFRWIKRLIFPTNLETHILL